KVVLAHPLMRLARNLPLRPRNAKLVEVDLPEQRGTVQLLATTQRLGDLSRNAPTDALRDLPDVDVLFGELEAQSIKDRVFVDLAKPAAYGIQDAIRGLPENVDDLAGDRRNHGPRSGSHQCLCGFLFAVPLDRHVGARRDARCSQPANSPSIRGPAHSCRWRSASDQPKSHVDRAGDLPNESRRVRAFSARGAPRLLIEPLVFLINGTD